VDGDCSQGDVRLKLASFSQAKPWSFKASQFYPMNYFIAGGYFQHVVEAQGACVENIHNSPYRFVTLSGRRAVASGIEHAKACPFFRFDTYFQPFGDPPA